MKIDDDLGMTSVEMAVSVLILAGTILLGAIYVEVRELRADLRARWEAEASKP